ncbi:MAG: hypothetical protein AB1540_14125 [Bdellovibrionota bacterium]
MKQVLFVLALLSIQPTFAKETKTAEERKPAESKLATHDVFVQDVYRSDFEISEKWIDKEAKVICYAVGNSANNARAVSISCVKQ